MKTAQHNPPPAKKATRQKIDDGGTESIVIVLLIHMYDTWYIFYTLVHIRAVKQQAHNSYCVK